MNLRSAALLLTALLAASPGLAASKSTLGVFLPTTLTDGQQRFTFAEGFATELSAALGHPVTARSFARYEDFTKAINSGLIDFAVVDAWAAVSMPPRASAVALAALEGETSERWAVAAPGRGTVKDLAGKRLAITRGTAELHARFASHAVFGGDLDVQKHFKLVTVPNVESALTMVSAKGAEAALVPLAHVPKDFRVLYRSSRLPGAVLLALKHEAALGGAVAKLRATPPFSAFVPLSERKLTDFNRLVSKGPAPRQPFVVDSPQLYLQTTALIKLGEVGLVLPSFVDAMDVPAEQPDP